jgi:hypothetical protein
MGKFAAFITGRNDDGSRRTETVTTTRDTLPAARNAVRQSLVPGERVVYTGPDGNGDENDQDVKVFGG